MSMMEPSRTDSMVESRAAFVAQQGFPEPAVNNGPAAAAFLSAGIGAVTLGLITVLTSLGVFAPPDFYAPVGALTGKVAITLAAWLIAWGALHTMWGNRQVRFGRIAAASLGLVVLALMGTSLPFLLR